jgi:hypothetical protein
MYRRVRFVAGDDEDDVQRRNWPARRHDDFREGPLVAPSAGRGTL